MNEAFANPAFESIDGVKAWVDQHRQRLLTQKALIQGLTLYHGWTGYDAEAARV